MRIEPQLAAPREPRAAFDVGNDRRMWPEGRLAEDPSGEAGADDALDHERIADVQLPSPNIYVCAYFSTIKKMKFWKFSYGGLTLSENLNYPVLELAVQHSTKRGDLL